MPNLKYEPVRHDHQAFLAKSAKREGFQEAYDASASAYSLASQLLAARTRAGLTQEAVASKMGTTKSNVSRIEAAGKQSPSLATLKRYAQAVGCQLEIKLVQER